MIKGLHMVELVRSFRRSLTYGSAHCTSFTIHVFDVLLCCCMFVSFFPTRSLAVVPLCYIHHKQVINLLWWCLVLAFSCHRNCHGRTFAFVGYMHALCKYTCIFTCTPGLSDSIYVLYMDIDVYMMCIYCMMCNRICVLAWQKIHWAILANEVFNVICLIRQPDKMMKRSNK